MWDLITNLQSLFPGSITPNKMFSNQIAPEFMSLFLSYWALERN